MNSMKISRQIFGLTSVLVANSRNSGIKIIKRDASIRTGNYYIQKYQLEHIAPLGWSLLLVPVATFGLGLWQYERKKWKEDLIARLETEMNKEPIQLPDDLREVEKMEYRPVKVRGKFLHEKELHLGPRSFIDKYAIEKRDGGVLTTPHATGYLIITPFKLEDRNDTILVNRGWVPRNKLDPRTRPEGQVTDTVELIGIARKNEARPQFTPKAKGKHYLYRDLKRMCDETGADPVIIDATIESTIPGGPIGGQTNVSLRNEHLSYIITWISLSGFSALFWYKLVLKSKK